MLVLIHFHTIFSAHEQYLLGEVFLPYKGCDLDLSAFFFVSPLLWGSGGKMKHGLVPFSYVAQQGMEPTTWVCVLTGNRNCNILVHRTTLQPAEPHQLGHPLTSQSLVSLRLQGHLYDHSGAFPNMYFRNMVVGIGQVWTIFVKHISSRLQSSWGFSEGWEQLAK